MMREAEGQLERLTQRKLLVVRISSQRQIRMAANQLFPLGDRAAETYLIENIGHLLVSLALSDGGRAYLIFEVLSSYDWIE